MSWRYSAATAGSGAHGDLNAHLVDLTRFLMGESIVDVHGAVAPTFVTSRAVPGTKRREHSDIDDAALFLATFEGGAAASFEATRLAEGHLNDNTVEINGERGSLRSVARGHERPRIVRRGSTSAPPRLDERSSPRPG
jgi:predicted dehydrogenase